MVNDSHAVLNFSILVQRSKTLENVTLAVYLYDSKTSILLEKMKIPVENEFENELQEINARISLERDRDYTIKFEAMRQSDQLFSKSFNIRGLSSLIPDYKKLKVNMNDVDFLVLEENNSRVKILARFYLYSLDDYSDVTFHLKAVQLESNLLADESWKEVDQINSGQTLLLESNLTIPRNYNYLVKLEAWRNGILLKKWSAPLKLSPTRTIPENVSEKEVELDISEFVQKGYQAPVPAPTPTPVPYPAYREPAPGFEVWLAILSVSIVALLRKKLK
jgi:hypothetical protein